MTLGELAGFQLRPYHYSRIAPAPIGAVHRRPGRPGGLSYKPRILPLHKDRRFSPDMQKSRVNSGFSLSPLHRNRFTGSNGKCGICQNPLGSREMQAGSTFFHRGIRENRHGTFAALKHTARRVEMMLRCRDLFEDNLAPCCRQRRLYCAIQFWRMTMRPRSITKIGSRRNGACRTLPRASAGQPAGARLHSRGTVLIDRITHGQKCHF